MSKKKPLAKSIKAAIPFLAAFGGQGFASNRVNSVSLSSRKFAKKPVIYVDNSERTAESFDTVSKASVKSPFAAFTNNVTSKTSTVQLKEEVQTFTYLQKSDLIRSDSLRTTNISGDIHSNKVNKSFSHNWTQTTLGGALNTASKTGTFSCDYGINPTNTNTSFYYTLNGGTATCLGFYYKGGPTLQTKYYTGVPVSICINLHNECDSQILPVELMEFDVD